MGINLGLDIGAISLKLAAIGKPADQPILESLCSTHPQFRLSELAGQPLVLSEYRRIAGSPIQSTYDLLHEFYEVVPEDRVEGNRTDLRIEVPIILPQPLRHRNSRSVNSRQATGWRS